MRPVISERASACARATRASRGTKNHSAATYSASQARKGTSARRSNPPTTTAIVTK